MTKFIAQLQKPINFKLFSMYHRFSINKKSRRKVNNRQYPRWLEWKHRQQHPMLDETSDIIFIYIYYSYPLNFQYKHKYNIALNNLIQYNIHQQAWSKSQIATAKQPPIRICWTCSPSAPLAVYNRCIMVEKGGRRVTGLASTLLVWPIFPSSVTTIKA